MDLQVQAVQEWLNDTYGKVSGWQSLDEDGVTGWATIYGLRRALQTELGISPVSSGFGDATTRGYVTKIGRIDKTTTNERLLRILSAALWCKGYQGLWETDDVTFANLYDSLSQVRQDLGLGKGEAYVDVALMASLLSMDAYILLRAGDSKVRTVQQWLNATYSRHTGFALVPCDGVFSRPVQRALFLGLQYEFGMADDVANGVFGDGTRGGLRSQATIGSGSSDGSHQFVHLFQAALTFNGYKPPFNGVFDSATVSATKAFQKFLELPVNGKGDYGTWCAALVSCGDTERSTTGFDTSAQLTGPELWDLVAMGYGTAGRYLVGSGKFISAAELAALKAANVLLLPIFQRYNNDVKYMTEEIGRQHGTEATVRARALSLPDDSLIYFAVDFDPIGEVIDGPVSDYFKGVKHSLENTTTISYRAGVYGTRNVCSTLMDSGLAEAAFVAGASSGYSGNMGFPMPTKWQFNQITTIKVTLPSSGRTIDLDKDVVSRTAKPVKLSTVVPPPVETDGSTSATGFDALFEWLVKAEVAAEAGLVEASSFLNPLDTFSGSIPSYIGHWLQVRNPAYTGPLWDVYTPVVNTSTAEMAARAVVEAALDSLGEPTSARDYTHFAATLMGYRTWDVPTNKSDYGLGDLGGWALDLLSIWGDYVKAPKGTDLLTFCLTQIGGTSGHFKRDDVIADADAWLMASQIRRKPGPWSQAARVVLAAPSATRVRTFYANRFGSSESNVSAAFARLVDGIDAWKFDNLPGSKWMLMKAAGDIGSLPDQAQTAVMGQAYARVMKAIK